jgi:hypothetical protein
VELLLHPSIIESALSRHYKRAFTRAVELFVVTAFLTEWDPQAEVESKMSQFSRDHRQEFWHYQEGRLRKSNALVAA